MRWIVAAVALVVLGLSMPVTGAAAEDADTVAAINAAAAALDKAFEAQDAKSIYALVTPDHVAVTPYYDGPKTVAEQVESLPDLKYEQDNLDEPSVTLLAPDVAMRSFRAELKGTYRGRPIPSPVYVTSIMVRNDGTWQEKFYQVTRTALSRGARLGRCRDLVGTYLTRNSAEGGTFRSRSLLSLDRSGVASFSDSGEAGEDGYAPFSGGKGAWRCAADGKTSKIRAMLLDFTFPKSGEAAKIGRLDLDLTLDAGGKTIAGTAKLTLVPLESDPLKADASDGQAFKIEGTRIEAP